MTISNCLKEYLDSLNAKKREGLRAALVILKAQLEIDYIKAVARRVASISLLDTATSILNSAISSGVNEIKGAFKAFGFGNFLGCVAVDSMKRLSSDVVRGSSDDGDEATYNKLKAEHIKISADDEVNELDSRKKLVDKRIEDLDEYEQDLSSGGGS